MKGFTGYRIHTLGKDEANRISESEALKSCSLTRRDPAIHMHELVWPSPHESRQLNGSGTAAERQRKHALSRSRANIVYLEQVSWGNFYPNCTQ